MASSVIKKSVYNYIDLPEITSFNVDINSLVNRRLYLNWFRYSIAGNPTPNDGILSTTRLGNGIQQIVQDVTGLRKCRYYWQGTWSAWT